MRRALAVIPWGRRVAPRPARGRLPGRVRKFAQAMLNQQCWCWGQDIRHGDDNLLMRLGLARLRPPSGTVGSTCYLSDGPERVALWGFGICFAVEGVGRVFVGRYAFRPRSSAEDVLPTDVWTPSQLRGVRSPRADVEWHRTLALLDAACHWMARYEQWVAETAGLEWRRAVLGRWDHPAAPAGYTAVAWRTVARDLARLPRRTA